MEILTKTELESKIDQIIDKIKSGKRFICPTDTIYGISCNALDSKSVAKIREIKNRPNSPLSIWVPSIDWIKENCIVNQKVEAWLNKLPGPYTLLLKLKNEKAVAGNVALNSKFIGIRYPDHWFNQILSKCGIPIITTSANKSGEQFMTSLDNLDQDIAKQVDFIIYEGEKQAKPSKIINVETEERKER